MRAFPTCTKAQANSNVQASDAVLVVCAGASIDQNLESTRTEKRRPSKSTVLRARAIFLALSKTGGMT